MRVWVKMSNHNDPKISFIILMKKSPISSLWCGVEMAQT